MEELLNSDDIVNDTGLTQDQGLAAFDEADNANTDLDTASDNVLNNVGTAPVVVATPKLAQYIKSSPEGAAAISGDIDKMSNVERMLGKVFTAGIRTEKSGNVATNAYQMMVYDNGLKFKSDIKDDLDRKSREDILKNEARELSYYSIYDVKDDKYWVTVPGLLTGAINGMVDAITKNPATAAAGAVAGFPIAGPLGSVTGALVTSGAKDTYINTAGQIWYDNYITLPEEVKKTADKDYIMSVALGAGAINATISAGSSLLLGSSVSQAARNSGLKQLGPQGVKELFKQGSLKAGANATLDSLYNLGQVLLKEFAQQGLTEGLQDSVSQGASILSQPDQLKGTTLERNYDINQTIESIIVGTGVGSLFRGAGALFPEKAPKEKGQPAGSPRDVTPKLPPLLPGGGSVEANTPIDVEVVSETNSPTTGTGEVRPQPPPKTPEILFFENVLQTRIDAAEQQKKIITDIADDIKDSKAFTSGAMKDVLSNIVPEDAYFHIDSQNIAKLESEREGFREAFERNTGIALTEDQGIYTLSAFELFKLMSEDKRVIDYVTLNPGAESLDTLKLMNEKWQNNEVINTALEGLQVENVTDENRKEINARINKVMLETLDGVYSKDTYILRTIVDDYVKNTIPLDVQNDLEKAIFEERAKIADSILANEKKREERIIFKDVKNSLESVEQEINNEIAISNTFAIERLYQPGTLLGAEYQQILRDLEPNNELLSEEVLNINIRSKHKSKKAYSVLAIDPSTLPKNYLDIPKDPRVKSKKIFVKGGLDYEKVGDKIGRALYGPKVTSPGVLFLKNILSNETSKEYYERRYDEEIRKEIATSSLYFGSMKEDFEKAFQRNQNRINEVVNVAENHPKIFLNFLRLQGRKFNGLKRNQKQEVLYNEVSIAATYYSYAMPVKNLNPKIYKANVLKFSRMAADSLVQSRFAEFFRYKYAETLNDFIEGNSVKLTKAIQDRIRYVRRINTKEGREVLYKAGEEYADAFNSLIGAISGDAVQYVDLQKVIQIVNQYREHGVVVPKSVVNLVNRATKVQVGDMTVSEALGILDTIISIYSAAQNDVVIKRDKETLSTIELEQTIEADLSNRPETDTNEYKDLTGRLQDRNPKQSLKEKFDEPKERLKTLSVQIQNSYTLVRSLDYGKERGFYSKLITDPIIKAAADRGQYNNTFDTWEIETAKKTMGIEKYNNINKEVVTMIELENEDRFPGKRVSKWDIIQMIAMFGSETGRSRVVRDLKLRNVKEVNGVNEQFRQVLEKYSTPEDVQFVAELHKYFRNVDFPRYEKRFKELGLAPPAQVIGLPYNMHGQEWMGGYFPTITQADLAEAMLVKQEDAMTAIISGTIVRAQVANINTQDGSILKRTEYANSPIKYGRSSFINVIRMKNHNHAFGQTMLEMSKIFGNRSIQKSMINFLGVKKFANLLGTIQNIANGRSDYDVTFAQHLDVSKSMSRYYKNMYVGAMGAGVGTFVRQLLGTPTMVNALIQQHRLPLGQSAKAVVADSMKQSFVSIMNPSDFKETIKAIATVSPQFQSNLNVLAKYPGWQSLLDLHEVLDVRPEGPNKMMDGWYKLVDASMTHILLMQLAINTVLWKTAYKSAMEGNIIGIEKGDEAAALIFSDKMVNKTGSDETGLDKSPLQRTMLGQIFFAFKNQINLQNNELIGGLQLLGTEMKNQRQVTSKGASGAVLTILSNSIIPAAAATLFYQVGKSTSQSIKDLVVTPEATLESTQLNLDAKPQDDNKAGKIALGIALDAASINPYFSIVTGAIESNQLYGQRSENIQINNPVLNITTAVLQTIVTAFDSMVSGDEVVLTQERMKVGLRAAQMLIGFPGANMIPTPLDPTGKSGASLLIDFIVKDMMNLPSRREVLTRPRMTGTSENLNFKPMFREDAPLDTERIDPTLVALQNPTPSDIPLSEQIQQLFDSKVLELQNPDLSPELRSYLEQSRDILYSVKGNTNPEGNEITTSRGTVKFDDYGRDFFTVTVEAIARLESNKNPNAVSVSGAKGLFQFLDSTWRGMSKLYPNFDLPANALLAPTSLQYQVYWKFLGENLQILKSMGQPWTSENIFLIHMMGPDDFKTFAEADPNLDLGDLLPTQFEFNPSIMAGRNKARILQNLEVKLDRLKVEAETFLKSEKLLTSKQ